MKGQENEKRWTKKHEHEGYGFKKIMKRGGKGKKNEKIPHAL